MPRYYGVTSIEVYTKNTALPFHDNRLFPNQEEPVVIAIRDYRFLKNFPMLFMVKNIITLLMP